MFACSLLDLNLIWAKLCSTARAPKVAINNSITNMRNVNITIIPYSRFTYLFHQIDSFLLGREQLVVGFLLKPS